MWFLDKLDVQAGVAYNEVHAFSLKGELDRGALERAVNRLVARHESLRTRFEEVDGTPFQVISPLETSGFRFGFEDVSEIACDALEEKVRVLRQSPFDLEQGPLFRAHLLSLGSSEHIFVFGGHHTIRDGWSDVLLLKELAALFEEETGGAKANLPALPIQYADYAVWQRKVLSGERLSEQLEWWKQELAGAPEAITLPFDRPRPKTKSYTGGTVPVHISKDVTEGLKALSSRHRATVFMVLETAYAALLALLGAGEDVVVGTAVAGRQMEEQEPLVGFFVNTLALRNRIDKHATFEEQLARTKPMVLEAFQHQEVPFEVVVDAISPARTMAHAPIIQTMLVLQNIPEIADSINLSNVEATTILEGTALQAKFDLQINLTETGDGLRGHLFYSTQLFDPEMADRIAAMFGRVLNTVVGSPDTRISDLPLVDQDEISRVLMAFNDTSVEYSGNATVVDLFKVQVDKQPDAVAIVDGDRKMDFRELERASARMAQYLIEQGVGPEVVVGVKLERSAELIVALLAIWKAGGAYLLLNPLDPGHRQLLCLKESRCRTLLVGGFQHDQAKDGNSTDFVKICADQGVTVHDIEEIGHNHLSSAASPGVPVPLDCKQTAYVTFTSGSTGTPKGVAIEHASLANFIQWFARDMDTSNRVCSVLRTPQGFDPINREIWFPLSTGGTINISRGEGLFDIPPQAQAGGGQANSYLQLTPSLLQTVLQQDGLQSLPDHSTVYLSGEAPSAELWRTLTGAGKSFRCINGYGPSEVSMSSSMWQGEIDPEAQSVPIGNPVGNTQIYVVNEHMAPVPIGVAGELLIGGAQVSRGYLGRPGQTAEKYIADPFSREEGARLYRTGDLARWRADGTLDFLGRIDTQVKIRGMRVELGEIEAALAHQAGIAQAAVAARKEQGPAGPDYRIIAYLVPDDLTDHELASALGLKPDDLTDAIRNGCHQLALDGGWDLQTLRSELGKVLPEHMIPSGFIGLSRLPLTSSGKVDRRALPEDGVTVASVQYVPPRNEREMEMCCIMRSVIAHDRLSLEKVGIDDNFFDIGGHSIFAAQFALRLEKAIGTHVPVRLVFEHPTIREMSVRLDDVSGEALPPVVFADRSAPIPASFEQTRMWMANKLFAGRPVYNEGLPMVLRGKADTDALLSAVQKILDRYEVLHTRVVWQDGRLLQEIDPPGLLKVQFEDWSAQPTPRGLLEKNAEARCAALMAEPYDLAVDYPCRALVLKLADDHHIWCLANHHIVGDNWSLSHVMPADFFALYEGALHKREAVLPELTLHYADYAAWQHSEALSARLASDLGWWTQQLADAPEVINLPLDRPRPSERTHEGRRISTLGFNQDQWRQIETFAVQRGGTAFMVFVAALSGVLSRLAQSSDIVIGTPHVMKPDAALWDEFGYFGNTLALRTKIDQEGAFDNLFAEAKQVVGDAFAHQYVPFEEVVAALGRANHNATPVFQVVLVMHAFLDFSRLKQDDLEISLFGNAKPPVAKHDLTVDVYPSETGVHVALEYATDIFDESTVSSIGAGLHWFLSAALAAPDTCVWALPLFEPEAGTITSRAGDAGSNTLPAMFALQVAQRRAAPAVTHGARSISYDVLDKETNKFARYLISLGIGPESVVGVCLQRSPDLIRTLLAILKTGAAYLPLDPEYPADRLGYMLCDADADLLITTSGLCSVLQGASGDDEKNVLIIDDPVIRGHVECLTDGPITDQVRVAPLTPESLAYIIYTSGSTGRPKGSLVSHHNVTRLLHATCDKFGFGHQDIWSCFHSYAFDFSVWETWGALCTGGEAVLVPQEIARSPGWFADFVQLYKVTVLNQTPTAFEGFSASVLEQAMDLPDLRLVIFGGEALVPAKLAGWFDRHGSQQPKLVNMYGITETTVHVTMQPVDQTAVEAGISNIGVGLDDLDLHVVDPHMQPVPSGVYGELLVGGPGLCRGYLGRAGLTSERFVADPFSGEPGARLYRTGDFVRWRRDGTLEYMGRIDGQVKIRGKRVELGEIEAALAGIEGIAQAAVAVQKQSGSEGQLTAYLVPKSKDNGPDYNPRNVFPIELAGLVDLASLRSRLAELLPPHMVPDSFVGLKHLPLTPSGKTDRSALPQIRGEVARAEYEQPVGQTEVLIAEAFETVLAIDQVGRTDSFFELGGNSLAAVRLAEVIKTKTGKSLVASTIFQHDTVEKLGGMLSTLCEMAPTEEEIRLIRENPGLIPQFEEVFGKGAAGKFIKGA
ncbi:non-ribosomal peptide synthetase [Roseibium sp. RKSG952]|uniref:non-ribosomal peptide synthetase n=1 Tax=Roseibium sp. RKSG952 TaxID=2529384 RepID=UPI001FCCA706|nr:non-ribosomal peptide synthetase [Roseibium sp. RKSG952]